MPKKIIDPAIYFILCPITRNVVYIGQTINTKNRFYYHCKPSKYSNNSLSKWELQLTLMKLKPIFVIVETFDKNLPDLKDHLLIRENYWINHFIRRHCVLFNNTKYLESVDKFIIPQQRASFKEPLYRRGPYKQYIKKSSLQPL